MLQATSSSQLALVRRRLETLGQVRLACALMRKMKMMETLDTFREAPIEDIVRAAQSGSREAFGELVERFSGMVRATALKRLRDTHEADELTQEVFVRAMEKLGQLHTPAALGGWLRAITHRLAINRLTRNRRTFASDPEILESVNGEENSPLDSLLAREEHEHVHVGLGRLKEMDRDTLVAFYVRGQSLIEMSRDFASPIGTIKRRLHVARKRLAKELESFVA